MRGEHITSSEKAQPSLGSSPHARGAPLSLPPPRRSRGGSSPHARGAHEAAQAAVSVPGIIPACAGSTQTSRRGRTRRKDHPRMRGEHSLRYAPHVVTTGSSPHARGARQGIQDFVGSARIIPACAGSTTRTRPCTSELRDHPRMRGEHQRPSARRCRARGSSPHARGARVERHEVPEEVGIIPACAGSTQAAA